MSVALCGLFFLSGVAGLVFEALWFHQSGLALGNSVWASSLVLAAFMGGLATGNGLAAVFGDRVRRPLAAYAALEVLVGVSGVALVLALPLLTPVLAPLLRPIQDDPWALNAVRTLTAFALMLLPSAAMGATLPLLTRALFARDPRFGPVLGRLYGWNTLGAVCGALLGDTLLIEWLGIRGCAGVAAVLNGLAAVVALTVGRGRPDTPVASAAPAAETSRGRIGRTLAAAFLAGATLLALEVVWFRFLLLSVSGTSLAFAVMLAVVLAGIGLGGLAGARWLAWRPDAYRQAPVVAALGAGACVLGYALFDAAPRSFEGRTAVTALETLEVALPLMLPTSLLSGILFTLLGEALHRHVPSSTRCAGLLTLANTMGAMTGSLLGGFVLLSAVGIEVSLGLLAASHGATALLALPGGPRTRSATVGLAGAGAVLLASLVGFPRGAMEERFVAEPARRFLRWEPVLVQETLTETLTYLRRDLFGETYAWRLLTNGHSMSGTTRSGRRYMSLFVHLPVALRPEPRSALLICYGLGVTATALVETPSLETIDVVDTSAAILERGRLLFPEPGTYPLDDPRVRVHVEDGRHFMQTTARRFDLITGEPPPPKLAGIVNLYTGEYFELVRERLADGGVATYWLPTKGLFEQDALAIVRAFCDVFADCSLWSGGGWDWILLGSRDGLPRVDAETLSRQWRDPQRARRLRDVAVEHPGQLGALFLAGPGQLRELVAGVAPLDDDHPKRLRNELPHPQSFFRDFARADAARERFRASPFARQLFSPELHREAEGWFDAQAVVERTIFEEMGSSVERVEALYDVLTGSDLTTLPQWVLASDSEMLRAARDAQAAGRKGAGIDFQLAAWAAAERRYDEAALHFERARNRPQMTRRDLVYLEITMRYLAGDLAGARELVGKAGLADSERETDRAFYAFLTDRFP